MLNETQHSDIVFNLEASLKFRLHTMCVNVDILLKCLIYLLKYFMFLRNQVLITGYEFNW